MISYDMSKNESYKDLLVSSTSSSNNAQVLRMLEESCYKEIKIDINSMRIA